MRYCVHDGRRLKPEPQLVDSADEFNFFALTFQATAPVNLKIKKNKTHPATRDSNKFNSVNASPETRNMRTPLTVPKNGVMRSTTLLEMRLSFGGLHLSKGHQPQSMSLSQLIKLTIVCTVPPIMSE